MQGSINVASEDWHKVVGPFLEDASTGRWMAAYRLASDDEASRWIRSRRGLTSDQIVLRDDDSRGGRIALNLPATITAHLSISEGTWRTSRHEVEFDLMDDDEDPPRVIVDAVRIRRLESSGVTAAALRGFKLQALVDWAMTREPLCDGFAADDSLYRLLPEVRTAVRRSGRKGKTNLDPRAVAEVAADAPARRLTVTLKQAFPAHSRSSINRALKKAREDGLLD